MEVIEPKLANEEVDKLANKVFMKAIEMLGGLRKIVELRHLTWVPSLAEASLVVVLKREALKTNSEIAKELGISEATVKNILAAKEADAEKLLSEELHEEVSIESHVAGALAKLAYRKLVESGELREEAISETEAKHIEEAFDLELFWALRVLKAVKGIKFPASIRELEERIGDIKIKNTPIRELLSKISPPIRTPAELLHKLKEATEERKERKLEEFV